MHKKMEKLRNEYNDLKIKQASVTKSFILDCIKFTKTFIQGMEDFATKIKKFEYKNPKTYDLNSYEFDYIYKTFSLVTNKFTKNMEDDSNWVKKFADCVRIIPEYKCVHDRVINLLLSKIMLTDEMNKLVVDKSKDKVMINNIHSHFKYVNDCKSLIMEFSKIIKPAITMIGPMCGKRILSFSLNDRLMEIVKKIVIYK
jgi:hypothetical protein